MPKGRKVDGLSERLRDSILLSQYSVYDLERKLNLDHTLIYSYMNGTTIPSIHSLSILAKACGVTTDYLIYGE